MAARIGELQELKKADRAVDKAEKKAVLKEARNGNHIVGVVQL